MELVAKGVAVFLMICGVVGVVDVLFCKGIIGVKLSQWLGL